MQEISYIPLVMVRPTLLNLPHYPLPSGYSVRRFGQGDAAAWARIEAAAGEFPTTDAALSHFAGEFGPFPSDTAERCHFVISPDGEPIGTVTAWYNRDFRDGSYGRLHWVAIHPDYQGRHLGKPLVAHALGTMARWHSCAYLTTQTTSLRAVGIYLDLGFEPYLDTEKSHEDWKYVATLTNHRSLRRIRCK